MTYRSPRGGGGRHGSGSEVHRGVRPAEGRGMGESATEPKKPKKDNTLTEIQREDCEDGW